MLIQKVTWDCLYEVMLIFKAFRIETKSVLCFSSHENSATDSLEESLSHRTTKEKLSEQELHEVSENISYRLNELDLVSESYYLLYLSNLASVMGMEGTKL